MRGSALDLPDEVVRHRRRQRGAAGDDRDAGGVAGEVQGGLAAGVAGTDDDDVGVLQRAGVRGRSAVEHPATDERLERRDAEAAVRHAAGEDDGVGGGDGAVVERRGGAGARLRGR